MMKRSIYAVLVGALMIIASPASADESHWNNNNSHGWDSSHNSWSSHRRDRYQTANVWDTRMGPTQRIGAAWLIRARNEIRGRIMTNVPSAGDPYTLWIVIFNNPDACVDGCNDEDLGNPAVRAVVYNGTGAISGANIHGGGVVNLDFEIDAGKLPRDLFVLFPIGEKRGLRHGNGFGAEVHLIIDQHPPIVPGGDSWIADLTQTNFPGTGPATSIAAGIFVACPHSSCPESIF